MGRNYLPLRELILGSLLSMLISFFFVSCTTYRLRSRGPSGRDARKLFKYLEPLGYQCEEKGNHCMCIQNEYLSSWLYGNVTQGKNIYASYLH